VLRKSEEVLFEELEEFYNMSFSRELRMIELKKGIEELKAELTNYKKVGGVQND